MLELPIDITTNALKEIKNIIQHKGIPEEYALRIGIKGGGCGASFLLGFDKPKKSDLTYHYEGITVLIEKAHLMYLVNLQVDFEETSEGVGFTFTNVSLSKVEK
ncbi:MAG: HesB/IscA family protein [Thermonemataceae bacterium]